MCTAPCRPVIRELKHAPLHRLFNHPFLLSNSWCTCSREAPTGSKTQSRPIWCGLCGPTNHPVLCAAGDPSPVRIGFAPGRPRLAQDSVRRERPLTASPGRVAHCHMRLAGLAPAWGPVRNKLLIKVCTLWSVVS
ncbi:hypothetical protein LX36DRAFT_91415 [Colletotrichum falcatum]|nr:hypothetical protein LX36DRAFT_91415 [Colletotrichum falcatum]